MSKYISLAFFAFLFMSCSGGQGKDTNTTLSARVFAEKIKEFPNAIVLDVRTPEEFSNGHLENAINFDWNGNDFENQLAKLDTSQPIFVYCLSGGRSAAAARKMRSSGFKQVYELEGGMMKLREENLPETRQNALSSTGMTKQEFEALLRTDKLVLVDFYADWCAPCKRMEPYLKEISNEMAEKVIVVRINVDNNQALCKELKIDALPTLQLYKNQALLWTNTGFIEKAEVVKQLL